MTLDDVLQQFPRLPPLGLYHSDWQLDPWSDHDRALIPIARQWLIDTFEPTTREAMTSHWIKNVAAALIPECGGDLGNGVLTAAAVTAGFPVEMWGGRTRNASIGASFRDVQRLRQELADKGWDTR